MTVEIFDMPQGSEEWVKARLGIPTASVFSTVLAKGRDGGMSVTRKTLLYKLAGEILTGDQMDNYSNAHFDRGHALEDEARQLYAFASDEPVVEVGFIRNGNAGCSPDALVGERGVLEIKTALDHILIEKKLKGSFPPEHVAQCQGNLWIAERDWVDLIIYSKPKTVPFQIRAHRDDVYIKQLSRAIDAFNSELAEIVDRVRRYDAGPADLKRALAESMEAEPA